MRIASAKDEVFANSFNVLRKLLFDWLGQGLNWPVVLGARTPGPIARARRIFLKAHRILILLTLIIHFCQAYFAPLIITNYCRGSCAAWRLPALGFRCAEESTDVA
jgi:hypothetical protein